MTNGLQYCRQASLLSLVVLSFVIPASSQTIIYVDADAVGSNDGSSWEDAFVYLQDGLAIAEAGDEIWVAEGVYRPDLGAAQDLGDRDASFVIPPSVTLLGGFRGDEVSASHRQWTRYRCVLSGDLLGDDAPLASVPDSTRSDNAFQVVEIPFDAGGVIIDGFDITGGNADDSAPGKEGGGIRVGHFIGDVSIRRVRIFENVARYGAGAYFSGNTVLDSVDFSSNMATTPLRPSGGAVYVSNGTVVLRNARFESNRAELGGALYSAATLVLVGTIATNNLADEGGAVFVGNNASFTAVNTLFSSNTATCCGGGAILNDEGSTTLVNTVFVANRADGDTIAHGAAIAVSRGTVNVTSSSFSLNEAQSTGSVFYAQNGSHIDLRNSVLYDNVSGSGEWIHLRDNDSLFAGSTIIQSDLPAQSIDLGGNLTADPMFIDVDGPDDVLGSDDDNLRVVTGSPTIDSGNNAWILSDEFDLDEDSDSTEQIPGDFDLNQRVYSESGIATVDMGAYEFGAPPIPVSSVPRPEPAKAALRIEVFPNPTHDTPTLWVDAAIAATVSVEVFDILGRRVWLRDGVALVPGSHRIRLPLSSQPAGLYFVSVANRSIRTIVPIIKIVQ